SSTLSHTTLFRSHLVIVGGGLASARVAQGYREAGGDDAVTLVSADRFPPYHRPPLSKRFLRGEAEREDTFVHSLVWYREQSVELRLETHAERVEGKELVLEDGERIGFDRLVLATGARPRTFGWPGEELDGVYTLRTPVGPALIREEAKDAGGRAAARSAGGARSRSRAEHAARGERRSRGRRRGARGRAVRVERAGDLRRRRRREPARPDHRAAAQDRALEPRERRRRGAR